MSGESPATDASTVLDSTSLPDIAGPGTDSVNRETRRDHDGARRRGRAVFSAIDLGTNNCRLLIARPERGGFRVIDAFSRIVRLGEGMESSGRISDAAIERAIEALGVCAAKIRRRRVTCMRSVATAACRAAGNAGEFMQRVREQTGIHLDIISPEEEARLAVVGCQSLLDPECSHALVFDIGGGSTELILVERRGRRRFAILDWTSMPFGVVNLTERFGCNSLGPEALAELLAFLRGHLAKFSVLATLGEALSAGRVQLLGTSGTVTTLAGLELGLAHYDRSKVDGARLDAGSMHRLARSVALMSREERVLQPCIGGDRADYVAAGCAILVAILEAWSFRRLDIADRGLREGVLRGLMGASMLVDGTADGR